MDYLYTGLQSLVNGWLIEDLYMTVPFRPRIRNHGIESSTQLPAGCIHLYEAKFHGTTKDRKLTLHYISTVSGRNDEHRPVILEVQHQGYQI